MESSEKISEAWLVAATRPTRFLSLAFLKVEMIFFLNFNYRLVIKKCCVYFKKRYLLAFFGLVLNCQL